MAQSHSTSNRSTFATPKGQGIRVKTTSRGKTLQAYNYTQNRYVSTGSVSGTTYEKGNCAILRVVNGKYNPSIALTVEELKTARDLGATFLRCITPEKVTYAISLSDFEKFAKPYTNSFYGAQLAVSVDRFAKTGISKKRNAITDNPRERSGSEFVRPEPKQLPMFSKNQF